MRALREHLVIRLRSGWEYQPVGRRFTKAGREAVQVSGELPKYTKIAHQVPSMARKRERTAAEDELARGVQIVPPKGTRLPTLLKRVQSWPCVEKAWIAPAPSAAGPKRRPSSR